MSLFHVIRRYLLITLLFIIVLGCASTFFIFNTFIHQSTDQILYEYKDRVENYVKLNDTLTIINSSVFKPNRIEERFVGDSDNYNLGFKDTLLYSEATGDFQPYRQLYFEVKYKQQKHLITLNQPTIVLDDLLYIIVGLLVLIFVLFGIFIYLIDFYLKRKAWSPFYNTMNALQNYDLGIGEELDLSDSGIKEFNELNNVLNKMVRKINADYENVKTFSEDISHEMQTPLAIVQSKLEILRQRKSEDKDALLSISAISKAISRLSKLNKSLLLLTKIRNDQFQDVEEVNIAAVINNYIEGLEELIEAKSIISTLDLSDCYLYMNIHLAEFLISNLISNAIRHNVEGGYIKVNLDDQKLLIENTCDVVNKIPHNLFERMVSKNTEDSTGLGMSIIKSICDKYSFKIDYSYPEAKIFIITLHFS